MRAKRRARLAELVLSGQPFWIAREFQFIARIEPGGYAGLQYRLKHMPSGMVSDRTYKTRQDAYQCARTLGHQKRILLFKLTFD
jgi:hypothetical protein